MSPSSHRVTRQSPGDACTCSGLCYRRSILSFIVDFQLLSSVQFSCSVVSDSLQPHELQHTRPPCPSSNPGVHSDSSIELVMPSSHLILCRPLFLLPPIPPSIRDFSNESTLHMRWPKLLSHVQLFVIPWTAAHQASLSLTVPRSCSNSCPLSW